MNTTSTRTFPPDRRSVTEARRFASQMLDGTPHDVREAVELMVSELATNCVRHVRQQFELSIRHTRDEIRVEVSDPGSGTPRMRSPGPSDPTGRGLRIVDMLSDEWGVTPSAPTGKKVWFRVALSRDGGFPAGRLRDLSRG